MRMSASGGERPKFDDFIFRNCGVGVLPSWRGR